MSAATQGLYKDAYERDSCGFGLIANLDDQPSPLAGSQRKGRVKLDFATRLELGRSCRAGVKKRPVQDHVEDGGISTIASYRSSQLFEIVGLSDEIVNRCFVGTESRIAGRRFR